MRFIFSRFLLPGIINYFSGFFADAIAFTSFNDTVPGLLNSHVESRQRDFVVIVLHSCLFILERNARIKDTCYIHQRSVHMLYAVIACHSVNFQCRFFHVKYLLNDCIR